LCQADRVLANAALPLRRSRRDADQALIAPHVLVEELDVSPHLPRGKAGDDSEDPGKQGQRELRDEFHAEPFCPAECGARLSEYREPGTSAPSHE